MLKGIDTSHRALDNAILLDTTTNAPVHVGPGLAPPQTGSNGTDLLHASGAIMQIAVHRGHLTVQRKQKLLARLDFRIYPFPSALPRVQALQLLVCPVHHFENRLLLEYDLSCCCRLQDSASCLLIRVHFHLVWIDLRVNHNPSSATQLPMRRDVDENWMLVLHQSIDNHSTVLEHLREHVASAARETPPVGENDQRQVFTAVEILDGLRSLESRVRKPDLTGLGLDNVLRLGVRGIRWDVTFYRPCLHCDDTDGDTPEAPTSHHNRLAPSAHVLVEASLVAETAQILTVGFDSSQHMARVIWLLARHESNLAVDRVPSRQHRRQRRNSLRHKSQPSQDSIHSRLVILDQLVCHTIGNHNVRPSKLVLSGVHLSAEKLVQGMVTRQNHGSLHHLDVPLAKPVEVGSDTHAASCGVRKSEDFVVCTRRLSSDHPTALQILDANAALSGLQIQPDDGIQNVPDLSVDRHGVRFHGLSRQGMEVRLSQKQVVEALVGIIFVHPCDLHH
mmetsp:Transcript_14117/g.35639  ORF Transcript_14117/g.35639 Transcript_14117/m.35639 type:complete len:505 (-) Transcript_14117:4504-6018(-)